jgi:cation-transporting ATPase I
MRLRPGALLSALADRMSAPGQRSRHYWVGHGRAHIEVKGVCRPENAGLARQVEDELARLEAVDWAEVNAIVGRVVVAFDDDKISVDELIEVIEGVEEAHGLAAERFTQDRPEHPADGESLRRQAYAIGAEIGGIGLSLAGRAVSASPLVAEAASIVSLVDATPALRRLVERPLGATTADLTLAVGNAVAQGLAQGPFGLMVDITHRGLRFAEARARQQVWDGREPGLHEQHEGAPPPALSGTERPVPLPSGPVESAADRGAQAALAVAAAVGAATRDVRTVVAASAAATPKAARLGREGFAAWLGRDLAQAGILAMDADTLRRLDRVDTVVLDARVLATGRAVLGSVWVSPDHEQDAEQVWLTAQALLDPASPAAVARRGEWKLGPAPDGLSGPAREAACRLRAPGTYLLAVRRNNALTGLAAAVPELDPLAEALAAAARPACLLVVAGRGSGVGERVGADRIVAGGSQLAGSVRTLQGEGHVVAVVSGRQHEALAAADVGIGVLAGSRPPWGAHLITGAGLADACRILEAVPVARAVSRRAAMLTAYGSGAGALLALAGPRSGAAARALTGVNGAAIVSLGSGAWSARMLAQRPAPVPAARVDWHALDADAVLERLTSSPRGLGEDEAGRRRDEEPAGPQSGESGLLRASLGELANPLTPALATGAGLSAATGSVIDAALIGGVMVANAVVGGVQRVAADRALRRLIDSSAVRVRVRRGSEEVLTTADQLVTGDVISVQAGDAVPADCRILEAGGVEADESSLTGESQLVPKSAEPTAAANVAERRSMLYAGTSLAAGTATAAVVAVGPATELGRSAETAKATRRPSGVQQRLAQLTRTTVPISLGAGAAIVAGGLLRGRPVSRTLGTGVSLAVAAVPEGLPFVATVAELSTARRLSRRNALVRNPGTIEALGRVDVLCFDKTGTLTEGRIVLHRVWAASRDRPLDALDAEGRAVLAAALRASPEHRNGERLAYPADRAVVAAGDAAGVSAELGADDWRMVEELPFESSRGYHAVVGEYQSGNRIAVKGAPETVLPMCSHQQAPGGPVRLDEATRQALGDEADRLARRGYRVLAVAERHVPSGSLDTGSVDDLTFAGLLAFTDPVRASAARAVQRLPCAGISIMMLTGDHPSTAKAIATELGIINGGKVMTGPELDALTDDGLDQLIGHVAVFARVTPEQKVRIVAALQRTGHVVAVTGDGANDAPAIRLADVGIALGLRGTNAAKEAADVVVTDDRIETIIDAIVEGRAMWTSVRDAISVLLGGNLGEIAFTTGSELLLPGGSPLNARQLLLVNLLTDMAPSMALATRPPATTAIESLLTEGPDASLGTALTCDVVTRAVLTSGAGAAAWAGGRMTGVTRARAGTVALVGIVGAQLGQTLLAGWHSPLVVASSVGSAALLAAVIQTPGASQFFGCRPLGPLAWGIGIASAAGATAMAPVLARAGTTLPFPGAQAPTDAAASQSTPARQHYLAGLPSVLRQWPAAGS